VKKPNTGVVVSIIAHLAVLLYALIGLPHSRFDAAPEAMAVEVMTSSEFDKLTKGEKTAKKVAEKPKVEAKKIDQVTPEPRPPAPDAKENVEAPPPAPEPPQKAETPPEPPKPEPKPEPPKQAEAPPPPPEPKPAELPKPPEKKVDDQSQAKLDDLIKKEVEKKPEPKKPEPKKIVEKKPEKPKPKFDPSKIASLVDKRDPGKKAQGAPEISDVTTAGISNGPVGQLALSELSRINAMVVEQVKHCWSPPVAAAGALDLAVVVQFRLSEDGSLMGQPNVMNSSPNPGFQSAADSAVRAVQVCSPLKLPAQFYDHWKFVEINFDPREML
jgi:colicin import membrane protein